MWQKSSHFDARKTLQKILNQIFKQQYSTWSVHGDIKIIHVNIEICCENMCAVNFQFVKCMTKITYVCLVVQWHGEAHVRGIHGINDMIYEVDSRHEYYRNKLLFKRQYALASGTMLSISWEFGSLSSSFSLSLSASLSFVPSFDFSNWESLSHSLHTFGVLHFVADVCLIVFPPEKTGVCALCMTKA